MSGPENSQKKPLTDVRVVVTRTRAQASSLSDELRALGADVVEVPMIEIVEAPDRGAALAEAVGRWSSFDWCVVTSPNGATALGDAFDSLPAGRVKVAAVGPATAAALENHGFEVSLVPSRFVAEGLVEEFPDAPEGGGTVVIPQAEDARDVLVNGLTAKGWTCTVASAYRTVPARVSDGDRAAIVAADIITFTSSSTAENFVRSLGVDAAPPVVICIGPITAATATEHGLTVTRTANPHTTDGLISAILHL